MDDLKILLLQFRGSSNQRIDVQKSLKLRKSLFGKFKLVR